jgi:hypothetical protein
VAKVGTSKAGGIISQQAAVHPWLVSKQTSQKSADLFRTFHRLSYVHLSNFSVLLCQREHKMTYIFNGKKSEDTLHATLRRVVKYSSRYEIFTSKRGMFSTLTL